MVFPPPVPPTSLPKSTTGSETNPAGERPYLESAAGGSVMSNNTAVIARVLATAC